MTKRNGKTAETHSNFALHLQRPFSSLQEYSSMASPMRSSGTHGGNNEPERANPKQNALAVPPLNSVPYVGSLVPPTDDVPSPTNGSQHDEKTGPSLVFFPPHTTQKEWDDVLLQTKSGIAVTGSAAAGKIGPIVGLVDIGESEDSYLFRVSLPGVSRDGNQFSCNIDPDGKITIRGVTTTGEKVVCKHSQIFRMQTQNLCPPGHFSITFHLPGPIDVLHFSGHYGIDGILEGLVKKS